MKLGNSRHPYCPESPSAGGGGNHAGGLLPGFLLVLVLVLGGLGFAWLRLPVSEQELLANFSKAQDFLTGAGSVGGLPWWSPMFLQGTSLAMAWSFMVTNVVLWAFSVPLGFLAGPKVAMLVMMGLGSLGVFLFLRKLVGDDFCAVIGGFLFLLCPSLLTRAAGYEHFVVVSSMALLPWVFFGLVVFFRKPGIGTALLPTLAFSAVTLAYGKTGVMALPVLLIYSAVEYFQQPAGRRPSFQVLAGAALAFVFLAVIPNLPALRESGFLAMFEFGPFQGWQNAFSTKSALGWVDRGGWLTYGIADAYAPTTGNGGTYLGLGVFAVFVIALFRGTLHETPEGRKARLFLALALLTFWFSFGPKGVLGGHFFFLSLSLHAPDFSPALGWFLLAAQVWVIFRLVPPEWPGRGIIASIFSLIYLIVPGFRILEWLPIYSNIRAPFDFFQVTGSVCVVISAAILARLLFSQLAPGVVRTSLATVLCCLVVLDVAPYAKPFFQGRLEEEVFEDFLAAGQYVRTSPIPGRVYAFSGRYFYLLTPYLTGRPLVTEAFNSYLQQRGAALLQGTAFSNDEMLATYFNIAGVSHVLIDKRDEDTPADLQGRLRNLLPVGFENERFVVLENKNSLGGGFLAKDFIQTPDSDPQVSTAVLGGAYFHLAVIELPGVAMSEPNLRGRVVEGRIEPTKPGEPLREGQRFQRVALTGRENYQSVPFVATGTVGWLVMNQAWHPDWQAFQAGKALKNHRAFLAFQAVQTDGSQGVEFRFQQPWWYAVCAGIGILSWAVVVFLVIFSRFLFPPESAGNNPEADK